ncbi:MAG: DUF1800 domain-containing protein [Gemmatimonadales bacterium]
MQNWFLTVLVASSTLVVPLRAQPAMSARDSARHVLNRLGYGPTPGSVDLVATTGAMRWVESQLETTRPGAALTERERKFKVLTVSTRDMVAMHANQVRRVVTDTASTRRTPTRAMADAPNGRTLRSLNAELAALTLVRAIEAEGQLHEVVADFWLNHFNVFVNKGFDRAYFRDHLERTIRPNSMGTFSALLIATAHSPAMLFYLDNVQSVAARTGDATDRTARVEMAARRRNVDPARAAAAASRAPSGINENYARELLELHTVGVGGGYTQQDVIDVARILTGWSVGRGNQAPAFVFNQRLHDRGAKQVLGMTFPAGGGEEEGARLLTMLAMHPTTMRHVSGKLCARLVSDQPSPGCIEAAVAAWAASGGSVTEVIRAIVHDGDFWSAANHREKFKTPLEFVVSAVRAIGAHADDTPRLAQQIALLGQPLFQQSVPTGYPESPEAWTNSGALLARMNFAIALAEGRVSGVSLDLDRVLPATPDHAALIDAIERQLLGGALGTRTRETIAREIEGMTDVRAARARAIGLALGGPEFQRQ